MMKKIIVFILPIMIMRLFGSDNFESLPEECKVLIFKNLNTKNLLKIQEVNQIFYLVFQRHFKKDKEKEIEEYIKNLPQFWARVTKVLEKGATIKMPQSNFLKEISEKLLQEFNLSEKPIKLPNHRIDRKQTEYYDFFMGVPELISCNISHLIDEDGFLLTHRLCGYNLKKFRGSFLRSFLNKAHCGNIALRDIKSLSWYNKMPQSEENILYNLLSNIEYSFNYNFFDNPAACFFAKFKKKVDPRAWFLYLTELKEKKDPILENEELKRLITWLEDEHKKDIAKHGFDVQKKLNDYLEKSYFLTS